MLPWLTRTKISTRIHNITSDRIKVNDLRGNPVEIATNVVWRVTDTAQALFDVANYMEFVEIQIESAVRAIGARYPYDDLEHKEVTLRGDAEVVSEELERELQERVTRAGITIDECRLTHLAYAQEIAQAMLRRQQAEAVIAARAEDRDRRRLDGRECDPAAVGEGRRRPRRRAQGGDGLEPDGRALLGAQHPARRQHRLALPIGAGPCRTPPKKAYPLRIEPALWGALERCAAADFRSVNAQIEVLLREALGRARRQGRAARAAQARAAAKGGMTMKRRSKPSEDGWFAPKKLRLRRRPARSPGRAGGLRRLLPGRCRRRLAGRGPRSIFAFVAHRARRDRRSSSPSARARRAAAMALGRSSGENYEQGESESMFMAFDTTPQRRP